VPAPYDVNNFLRLLGIEIDDDPEQLAGRFIVRHDLIAGTGYLWAPVVIALALPEACEVEGPRSCAA